MKFQIEKISLTDELGKALASAATPTFHIREAESVDQALHEFVREDGAQIVGDVLKFPGFQAIATVRRSSLIYTLQLLPVSDRHQKV